MGFIIMLQEGRAAYLLLFMAVFWCGEVIPLGVTGLLPIVLVPLFGIMSMKEVCYSYFEVSCLSSITHWGRDKMAVISRTIFKSILLNVNVWISLQVSLTLVPGVRINNITALVQKIAWHRPGDKPLSEPVMVSLLTDISASLGLNGLNLWRLFHVWSIYS